MKTGDGNAVLYCNSKVIWDSETKGSGVPRFLVMQNDGKLVLYTNKGIVWTNERKERTQSSKCPDRLLPNQDLRVGEKICSPNGRYHALIQNDANFVLVLSYCFFHSFFCVFF